MWDARVLLQVSFLNITGFRDCPLNDLPMIKVLKEVRVDGSCVRSVSILTCPFLDFSSLVEQRHLEARAWMMAHVTTHTLICMCPTQASRRAFVPLTVGSAHTHLHEPTHTHSGQPPCVCAPLTLSHFLSHTNKLTCACTRRPAAVCSYPSLWVVASGDSRTPMAQPTQL